MRLPQRNAFLLTVGEAGVEQNYDRPAAEGPAKFEGRVGVYYQETRRRPMSGAQEATRDVLIDRTLIVDARTPNIEWESGDKLTFEFKGTVRAATVQDLVEKEHPSKVVQGTVRLPLEVA